MQYISMDELLTVLRETQKRYWDSGKVDEGCVVSEIRTAINDAIRSERIPQCRVKDGAWKQSRQNWYLVLVCSVCRTRFYESDWANRKEWQYCPACGARMIQDQKGVQL